MLETAKQGWELVAVWGATKQGTPMKESRVQKIGEAIWREEYGVRPAK